MSSLETKSIEFGLKLFKLLSNGDNCLFSPFSLTTCLSMVLMATRNTSSKQITESMFGKTIEEKDLESLATNIKEMIDKSFGQNKSAIISTNFMFTDSKFEVLSQFKQLIEKYFLAKIKELDLKTNKSLAINAINSEISCATNGKIDKLLEDIAENTEMILINALYFKGLWKTQFIKDNTMTDKFTANSGQQIDVQMMFQSRDIPFGYSQHLKTKAIELNYENTNAVMILLLPDIDSSTKQLTQSLSIESINQLVQTFRSIKVDLSLPKFKIESTYDLIQPLTNIGIKAIFQKSADFSGLSLQKGLFVSQVIQKAIIEVNEEGTEAAVATAVGISVMCLQYNEEFRANRPFIYLLVTKNDVKQIDSILFIGECNHPKE